MGCLKNEGCLLLSKIPLFQKKFFGFAEPKLPRCNSGKRKKKGKTIKAKRVTLMALSWQAGTRCRCSGYQDCR